jgi:hypothetical protein
VSSRPPHYPNAPGAVAAYLRYEHLLLTTYLRTPLCRSVAIDTFVQRCAATVRRIAALPIYVRQHVASWSGECDGQPLCVTTWGKRNDKRPLFALLFDNPPQARWLGRRSLSSVLRSWRALDATADVFIAETTPLLAALFERRGFAIIPLSTRFAAVPEVALGQKRGRAGRSLRSNLARVRQSGYEGQPLGYERELSLDFYHRYLVPTARTRFGSDASIPPFDWVDRLFRAGFLFAVRRGDLEPDALCLTTRRGATLHLELVGMRDGNAEFRHAGALTALDQHLLQYALENRLAWWDAGRSRPWLDDGVARSKLTRGFQLILDRAQTLEYALRLVRHQPLVEGRLRRHRVVVRRGTQLAVWKQAESG